MRKCFKCGGTEIAEGKITRSGKGQLFGEIIFQPRNVKFFTFALLPGTELDPDSYACLNCGLVWSQTNAIALREFIQKHCKPSTVD